MSVQFSKAAVIEKNSTAISACDASVQRLEQIVGLPVSKEAVRLAQLNRAKNEKTELRSVNAHLRAAGTTVTPMSEQTAQELNDLGNKLDDLIAQDAIVGATISFITSVMGDINRLRNITSSHKG